MARIISKFRLLILLGAIASFALPTPAHGQDRRGPGWDWILGLRPPDPTEPRAYVNVPVSPTLAAEFHMRLMTGKQQESLRKTLAQIALEPQKYGFDPELFKKVDPDHPMIKVLLHNWMVGTRGDLNPHSLALLQTLLHDSVMIQNYKGKMPPFHPVGRLPPKMPPPLFAPKAPVEEDGLTKLMHKFMRDADTAGLGDYVKQSPSWHDGMAKLRGDQDFAESPSRWNELVKEWGLADRVKLTWGDNTLNRLGKLSLPELPKISLDMNNLGWSRPNLQLPGFSVGGGISGGETLLLAILVAGLVVCAWQFFKVKRRREATAAALLGPWPVAPSQVRTRAQLITAFEYLAYLRLGPEVKTWNHRLIAAALAPSTSPLAEAADQLSRLYEQARYTQGDDTLQPADQDQAQHTLTLLAAAS